MNATSCTSWFVDVARPLPDLKLHPVRCEYGLIPIVDWALPELREVVSLVSAAGVSAYGINIDIDVVGEKRVVTVPGLR